MQDLNWSNNFSARSGLWSPPGEWAVWKQLFANPPLDEYYSVLRPIIWYEESSRIDAGIGMKFGMNNSYSGDVKLLYKVDPSHDVGVMDWSDHVEGKLYYSSPVDWIGRLGSIAFDAEKMYGIGTLRAALAKVFRPTYWRLGSDHSAQLYIESQKLLDPSYSSFHSGWSAGTVQVGGLQYSIAGETPSEGLKLLGETSLWSSDAKFARMKAEYITNFGTLRGADSRLRIAAGSATNGTPVERQFYVDRANNYEEQSSGLFRAVSGIDRTIGDKSGMLVEGGAGARGYARGDSGVNNSALVGTQMLGISYDIGLPNPLASLGHFPSTFGFGLFADAGWVGTDVSDFWSDFRSNLRTDAGLKIGINVLSWLPAQLRGVAEEYASIPTVNVFLPLYENHPLDGKKPIDFRWTVSLGAKF